MYIHISIKISLCNHLCLYYIKHEFKLISPTTSPHWSFKAISPCSPENFHFNKEMPGSTICHPQTHLFSFSGFKIVNLYTHANNFVNQSEMLVCLWFCQFSSVAQSCPTLWPHESQHARPPCLPPTPRVHPDSGPSSQWCHPAISSSVVPFSSCPQSLPAAGSFPMSQLFASGGQSSGVSALASFLPKKSQGWSPSQWAGWISLQSKGLSRVFSNTTVQKHQFFSAQPSSQSNSHIHTWPQKKP